MPAFAQASWWDANWNSRVSLTFDNTGQPEDLGGFPVLVILDGTRVDYGKTQNLGQDIRFVDADDATVLPHEIESWDELGLSYVWVKVPLIDASSATDHIYLYFDNGTAPDAQNRTAVWSSGYASVWHLDNDPSGGGPIVDSSPSLKDGVGSAGMDATNRVTGRVGRGMEFDGLSDYIRVPSNGTDNLAITGAFLTLECWAKRDGSTSGNYWMAAISRQFGTGSGDSYIIGFDLLDPSVSTFKTTAGGRVNTPTLEIPDATWKYIVAVQDATNLTIYADGAQVGQVATEGLIQTDVNDVILGANENFGDSTMDTWFVGTLDEVRIASVARSSRWVAAQHLSMTDGFITYGQTEAGLTISGIIFEDADFTGTASDWDTGVNDLGLDNVDVELYDSLNAYVTSVTTTGGGTYTFTGLSDDTYKVRVRSATIGDVDTPPQGTLNATVPVTWPSPLAEMTWGNVGALYGGQDPTIDDTFTGDNLGPGDTYVTVTVSGTDVTGVNLGFAYNLIVNTADDGLADATRSDQGSLRQFLKNANAIGAAGATTANSSQFHLQEAAGQIDGADSWWRITPIAVLPALTDPGTDLDGATQTANGGDSNSRGPEVEIDGATVLNVYGLTLTSADHVINGLVINGFDDSPGTGIVVDGASATGVVITGCYVGTNAVGDAEIPNFYGILLANGAAGTVIGGGAAGEGNVISGQNFYGIHFDNAGANTTIRGNRIGTNAAGDAAMANMTGIYIDVGTAIVIGGPGVGEGNLISGNITNGINLRFGDDVTIQGNWMGLNLAGTDPLPDGGTAVYGWSLDNVLVGGPGPGEGNIIAGNDGFGISLGAGCQKWIIQGNSIGVGPLGTETNLGNTGAGNIRLSPNDITIDATIGGEAPGEGNLIAYASGPGIECNSLGAAVEIIGNVIRNNAEEGITARVDSLTVAMNLIYDNGAGFDGILIQDVASEGKVYQNTIHGSGDDGIEIVGLNHEIRNNIITGSAGYGINVNAGTITESNNLVTGAATSPANTLGAGNVALDPSDLDADPLYLNAAGGDFSLAECTSPAINTGLDLGGDQPDVNGGDTGLFTGPAPDMGVLETPCLAASTDINGRVFEDADFAGTASGWDGGVGDVGQPGVDVELYTAADLFVATAATDGSGNFTFSTVADGSYKVRVRAATLGDADTPPAGGLNASVPTTWPFPLPEMTWANGSGALGGQDATIDDTATGDDAGPGDTWAAVTVSGASVTGVDFGFAYNLIVHAGDDGLGDAARSDQGSLRQFLKNANAIGAAGSTTANSSEFRMQVATNQTSGADSWWRITPTAALPDLADGGAVLDGSTQRANSGTDTNTLGPEIELYGASAGGSSNGLELSAGTSTIRELAIGLFSVDAIDITGGSTHTIVGSYLGADATGLVDYGNANTGIDVAGASGCIIGGTGPDDRNVIAYNGNEGINFSGGSTTGNTVLGNYVGLAADGITAAGNADVGIAILSGSNGNTIGGLTTPERNVISMNLEGVEIGSSNNTVRGNYIGTDKDGIQNRGQTNSDAVEIVNSASGNTIEGNLIAFTKAGFHGVSVQGGTQNGVLGNQIHSNTGLGINLGANGVQSNDGAKTGGQPNLLMDHPVFTVAVLNGTTLTVAGYVGNAPSQSIFASARVEVFESDNDGSGFGEGKTYLGFVTTDANGNFSGAIDVTGKGLLVGENVTGTASDSSNNTSEFGAAFAATGEADLRLAKIVDDGAPNEGDTVTYTVTLTNDGPNDATGVAVTDLLPAGVTYVSDTPSQGTYVPGTGIWTVGNLVNTANVTLQLVATADAATAGSTITNNTSITAADQADPNSANNTASANIGVSSADLQLTKIVDNNAPNEGDTVTYTVTLTNAGPNDATGITVTDLLPAGVTYVSDTPSQGSYVNGTGIWTVGSATNASNATLTLVATVDGGTSGSTITNNASITAADQADSDGANNTASAGIVVSSSDLQLAKVVDNNAPNEGDTVTYSVTLTNAGPNDATGATVTDLLPAGVTFQSAQIRTSIGLVQKAANAVLNTNSVSATFSSAPTEGNLLVAIAGNRSSSDPPPDPSGWTLIEDGAGNSPGQLLYYKIAGAAESSTVSLGPYSGTSNRGLHIYEYSGVDPSSPLSSSKQGDGSGTSVSSGNVNTTVGGSLVIVGFTAQANTTFNGWTGGFVEQYDFGNGGPMPTRSTYAGAHIIAGTPGAYSTTATVGTSGSWLMQYAVFNPTSVTSGDSYSSGTGVWDVGSVANGFDTQLTIVASVDGGTAGSTITNDASITAADQTDPDGGNNTDSASITVSSADLQITKSVDNNAPDEGGTVTYTVTLTNAGPSGATGISVTDLLPAGVNYVSDTPSQGSYASGTGIWTVGNLADSSNVTLQLVATVDAGTAGTTVTNNVAITAADQADSDGTNDTASAGITVSSADLTLAKVVDNNAPNEGDTVTYTVTLTNAGPNDATGITVTDLLPAGVTYVSDTPSQGSYVSGTGLWTVGGVTNASNATLTLVATVDAGTAGTVVTNTASVTTADQADPDGANNTASANIGVSSADLQLAKVVDNNTPNEGDTVTYTVTLTNAGPNDATGITVTDLLPAGVTYVSDTPSQGSFVPVTGVWTVGNVADSATVTLSLVATVDGGTSGTTITNNASITAADQADPDGVNNTDSAGITVSSADLQLAKVVDNNAPNEGDTVTYTVTLTNAGPNDATGLTVTDLLPAGVTYVSDTPSQGAYVSGTGLWTVGGVTNASNATLTLVATVDGGTSGTTITNNASITAADQADPDGANNTASAGIAVSSADLQLAKVVDNNAPNEGDTVTYTVTLTNAGPNDATGVTVSDLLPAGVTYVSDTPSQGSYVSGTGTWTVGSLTNSSNVTLQLVATVDAGTAGATVTNNVAITAADQADPNAANNTAQIGVDVQTAAVQTIQLAAVPLEMRPLQPGGAPDVALRVRLVNPGNQPQSLETLTVTNTTTGPGTSTQLDGDWRNLTLLVDDRGLLASPRTQGAAPVTSGIFNSNRLTFSGLDIALAPGDTVTLVVEGQAALGARDGDIMGVAVGDATDIRYAGTVVSESEWPLSSAGGLSVDGMVADQIDLRSLAPALFGVGSIRNLALDVALPANGYVGDELERLNIINIGSARDAAELSRIEAWADQGDEVFDPATDTLLGEFAFTGSRWELTGLSHVVPLDSLRIYITVDIAEAAEEGRTIQFGLPTLPDVGIGMVSGNDGPIDREVINPFAQAISTSDRVVLSAGVIVPGDAAPGESDRPLLHLVALNAYATDQQLVGLSVRNGTAGMAAPGTPELDDELDRLELRADGNGDGRLGDLAEDPVVATGHFQNGVVSFSGLSWNLPAGSSSHLFLTGGVSLHEATDGDILSAYVAGSADFGFAGDVALSGSWPLDSGARWTVDGMVAAQVVNRPAPSVTLIAGEGPDLVLDLEVPAAGYAADTLTGLRLVNLGSATASDFADLRLWRDGGDGIYSRGGGDDVDLGPLTWVSDAWYSPLLNTALPTGGTRLFVGLTVAAAPTNAATVRMAVPIDGITVASDHDGPLDQTVASSSTILLSTSPLVAELRFDQPISTVGQTVTARMILRNVGTETLLGVTPQALVPGGDGALTLGSGPTPISLDLAPGAVDSFSWNYTATSSGIATLTGNADGTEQISGLVRSAVTATTGPHQIADPVTELGLFAVANMPFTINRGQTDIVPLTLTFVNSGGASGADALIQSLRIRLVDDMGVGIVPSDLLSRVVVNEGGTTYLERNNVETSGNEIDLTLSQPVRVTGLEPVTLGLRLDIQANTSVPAFRVEINDASWFVAIDAISLASVPVQLNDSAYPIRSGMGSLLTEATRLEVAAAQADPQQVAVGQADITLLTLNLLNPGAAGLGSDVRIGSLAVSLTDTNGTPVAAPSAYLERLRVEGPLQNHLDIAVADHDSSVILLALNTPMNVPVDTPVAVHILTDLADPTTAGAIQLRLVDLPQFQVRDGNSGAAVPVYLATDPVAGPPVVIQQIATEIMAQGDPLLPAELVIGAREVDSIAITLRHPGAANVAAIQIESLVVQSRDENRDLVSPTDFIDALRVLRDDAIIGAINNPTGNGFMTIALTGVILQPGETVDLTLSLDLDVLAVSRSLELLVAGDGIQASDGNVGLPVTAIPESGEVFPLTSGLTRLLESADELRVGFASLMPAVLLGSSTAIPAARITLRNPSEDGMGSIGLTSLTIHAADAQLGETLIGESVEEVRLYRASDLWASSGVLSPTDTVAVILAPGATVIGPTNTLELELAVVYRAQTGAGSIRLGFDEEDVGLVVPQGTPVSVQVRPEPGQTFPFWSESGSFSAAGLAGSYSNFPNPFAAGREQTTFVFALEQPAAVTLRLLTAHNRAVISLLDSEQRSAGLHQTDVWDGRNGRGGAVQNGVYIAELIVVYADGSKERIRRKVAVVR